MTTPQPGEVVSVQRKSAAVYVVAGAAGLLLLLASVWAMWPSTPGPEGNLLEVAKFVASARYDALPEPEKRPYMKKVRSDMDQIAAAAQEGRLTQQEYEVAYLNSKLERRMDDMQDFFSHPAASRLKVLTADYAKKSASSKSAKPQGVKLPEPDGQTEEDYFQRRVAYWPAEDRGKWEEFERARKLAKNQSRKQ